MTARTFRCRLVRQLVDDSIQTMTYIGSIDGIPAGWSIVMRRVVLRSVA